MKKDLNYSLINKIMLIAIVISTYLFFDYAGVLKIIVKLFLGKDLVIIFPNSFSVISVIINYYNGLF